MKFLTSLLLFFLAVPTLPAQTLTEAAVATGGAAGAAAAMQKIGKATAGLLERSTRGLEGGAKTATPKVTTVSKSARAPGGKLSPQPVVKLSPPPDPAAIKMGMGGEELIAKFGKPSMTLASEEGETWIYGSGPDEVTLTLRDGKATAVSGGARPKEAAAQAVVVVQ
jgi:hypothetical protein